MSLCLILFALALLLDYMKRKKKCNRCPPGPAPLPFIGNILWFNRKNPSASFLQVEKMFGPIFLVQAGWQNFVIINGFKLVKEALGSKAEDFIERPALPLLSLVGRTKKYEGIILATSHSGWKEQKRFCVSALKNFGMGKKTLEKKVCEEAWYLCSELKSKEGSPFDPKIAIFKATGNIISTLAFGDRFEYHDENFLKLIHGTEEILKGIMRMVPEFVFVRPWFSYLPGPHQKIKKGYDSFTTVLKNMVDEHKKTRDPAFPRDLIDAFLEEIEKAKGNPETTFSEENLIHLMIDLFAAGTDTTSVTLLWGLLKMILHPEVQKRVQEEIDMVIGRIKSPTMEDQSKLPYTNAVIHEIQRCADIAPASVPYMTYRDTEVANFVIPKGTVVVCHLSSVLKDATMWEKPHDFYPEHFLDANGKFIKQEAFLPFSAGRRSCTGEQLAKTELFIFFTTLLQHFTFCIPENYPKPTEERIYAVTVTPAPFQLCAIPR
ncbi:cytochrome P450 2D14-like [Anolis sagrei]|uniref:cytochrome P450 2D14-like n=1 Tax=Anolis sagrei TaxID=38937 RepID=UPI003522A7B3